VVELNIQDEALMVHAFVRGVLSGPFGDSLIRSRPRTFSEIRRRAIAHIIAEETMTTKHGNGDVGQYKPRDGIRTQPMRVHETITKKKLSARWTPYESKKNQSRSKSIDDLPYGPKFKVSYKELLAMPDIVSKLMFPPKTDKVLGPGKNTWC